MSEYIGRNVIPEIPVSGLTFSLKPDFGSGQSINYSVISHRFGELETKASQTFQVGIGPRKFTFRRASLSRVDRQYLADFWEATQGATQSFTYNAPSGDGTFTNYTVIFDNAPLSLNELVNRTQVGITFVEVPDPTAAPSYSIVDTRLRFPDQKPDGTTDSSHTLSDALLSQVQQIIPLVRIVPRRPLWIEDTATYSTGDWVAFNGATWISLIDGNTGNQPDTSPDAWRNGDIYVSDRRCTVGNQLYQPRLLNLGEAGSTDVIISQNINGQADNVQFTLNNADRIFTQLSNDTDLKYASIELSLYHVQAQILLNLWKGFVLNYQSDGTANFNIQASDGLWNVTQQYPPRVVSRTCWKTFNDGVNCPFATKGHLDTTDYPAADANSCDFYFDSKNGCLAHGMADYFGGHPAQPQGVFIKDDSTGLFGFQRNRVTAVSIISDTVFGQPLPQIWCNSGGDPAKAFMVNALMVDYRDESTFFDSLGIVGEGPIGQYAIDDPPPRPQTLQNGVPVPPGQGEVLVTNADGFPYAVGPQTDGFFCQGAKVDITHPGQEGDPSKDNDLGLRQVHGFDPAQSTGQDDTIDPSFSLGQGTPQVYGGERAAGTAFVELRSVKPSKIQPSTPDQHSMTVPIAKGLSGYVWDSDGNRTLVEGLTNPFWIAVNCYLRCLGLDKADSDTQLQYFDLYSLVNPDGVSGCAQIADLQVAPLVGDPAVLETQFQFQGRLGQQKPFRDWLKEIVQTGLGYYTFEFGKLKLGIRENAAAITTFTVGNMLF